MVNLFLELVYSVRIVVMKFVEGSPTLKNLVGREVDECYGMYRLKVHRTVQTSHLSESMTEATSTYDSILVGFTNSIQMNGQILNNAWTTGLTGTFKWV